MPDHHLPPTTRKLVVSLPEKRLNYGVVGDTYSIVITGNDSADAYAFIDMLIPPGGGPGPHAHEFDEMFYVLEGQIEVFCQDQRTTALPFFAVNIPGWAPHMFKNFSNAPARLLCFTAPAGIEKQFVEMGKPVATRLTPAPPLSATEKADFIKNTPAIVERYHGQLLPPDTFDHLMSKNELNFIETYKSS